MLSYFYIHRRLVEPEHFRMQRLPHLDCALCPKLKLISTDVGARSRQDVIGLLISSKAILWSFFSFALLTKHARCSPAWRASTPSIVTIIDKQYETLEKRLIESIG